MQTRILIFQKYILKSANNAPNSPPKSVFKFACTSTSFLQNITATNLDEFANANKLSRYQDFDWAVGNAGANCCLMEYKATSSEVPLLELHQLNIQTGKNKIVWYTFPELLKLLSENVDKNYLQLAVQYLSAGGITDNVLPTELDKSLLEHL